MATDTHVYTDPALERARRTRGELREVRKRLYARRHFSPLLKARIARAYFPYFTKYDIHGEPYESQGLVLPVVEEYARMILADGRLDDIPPQQRMLNTAIRYFYLSTISGGRALVAQYRDLGRLNARNTLSVFNDIHLERDENFYLSDGASPDFYASTHAPHTVEQFTHNRTLVDFALLREGLDTTGHLLEQGVLTAEQEIRSWSEQ